MVISVAKKGVPAVVPAKPVASAPPPAPVQDVAAEVDAQDGADEDDETSETKAKRLTRKDFPSDLAGWIAFCDYKKGIAAANVKKWQDRVNVWETKKTNKDADSKEKKEKKADKLLASWTQTQRDLGVPEAVITAGLEAFKKTLASFSAQTAK